MSEHTPISESIWAFNEHSCQCLCDKPAGPKAPIKQVYSRKGGARRGLRREVLSWLRALNWRGCGAGWLGKTVIWEVEQWVGGVWIVIRVCSESGRLGVLKTHHLSVFSFFLFWFWCIVPVRSLSPLMWWVSPHWDLSRHIYKESVPFWLIIFISALSVLCVSVLSCRCLTLTVPIVTPVGVF